MTPAPSVVASIGSLIRMSSAAFTGTPPVRVAPGKFGAKATTVGGATAGSAAVLKLPWKLSSALPFKSTALESMNT